MVLHERITTRRLTLDRVVMEDLSEKVTFELKYEE